MSNCGRGFDSCAANSVTQQTVCIDTSNVVYLINGTTAEKLKSSGRGNLSFSGGDCTNGGREVVDAVADGKSAGIGIAAWLEAKLART